MNKLLDRIKHIFWVKFLLDVFAHFGKDNGGLLAAGLAFFMVLAFVPLLLVGLWVLAHLYANRPDEAVQKIQELLSTQVMPGAAGSEVKHLMERAAIVDAQGHAGQTLLNILHKRGIAGIIGILGVVWAAMQIFINGAVAMNAAWETAEKRGWVKLRLVALALLVGGGALLVVSLVATGYSTKFSDSHYAKLFPFEGALIAGVVEIAAVVVSAIMYAVMYRFLPSATVSWKAAFAGGIFGAIAWEIAKKGLAVYLLHPNKSLYGELSNLIVFVLWVLYSMMILVLGAEVSAMYAQEVEGSRTSRLKKAASLHPAADVASSSGSPLARAKEKNRAQRIRKTGQKEGQQARR